MVHGYAEGHREIASSLRLKARDARTVSVLSDVSSSGFRIPERGYLTGYPLSDSNAYVLARTWPASEVSRPGAVWTHSLVVEFADLPSVTDALALVALFRRPTPSSPGWETSFRHAIALDVSEGPPNDAPSQMGRHEGPSHVPDLEEWTAALLVALYEMPSATIAAPISAEQLPHSERVVLALWSQQWPRLRRNFRFCTQTLSDRKAEGAAFDVQIYTDTGKTPRMGSSAFNNAASLVRSQRPAWLETSLFDLARPGTLRSFLLAVGSSAEGGRASYVRLVTLYRLLTKQRLASLEADEVLDVVNSELTATSPHLEAALLRAFLPIVNDLSPAAFEYVLERMDSPAFETISTFEAELIGKAAWSLSRHRFVEMLHSVGVQAVAARQALSKIPAEAVISAIAEDPSLSAPLLDQRPDLLQYPSLWMSGEEPARIGIDILAFADVDHAPILNAMAATNSRRLLEQAVQKVGPDSLWRSVIAMVNHAVPASDETIAALVQTLAQFPNSVAGALASRSIANVRTLHLIALHVTPDAVPNEYGHDPWLIALQEAGGEIDRASSLYLASFLFARALGLSSRSCAELVESSFDAVYSATASDSISSAAWGLVLPRLPQPGPWSSWDRCQQLRYAVAQLYVERGLSTRSFFALGNDDVFRLLVRAAAKQWRGRSFLRSMRDELELGIHVSASRMEIVDRQLDSWL